MARRHAGWARRAAWAQVQSRVALGRGPQTRPLRPLRAPGCPAGARLLYQTAAARCCCLQTQETMALAGEKRKLKAALEGAHKQVAVLRGQLDAARALGPQVRAAAWRALVQLAGCACNCINRALSTLS